jgi:hypothetical protein
MSKRTSASSSSLTWKEFGITAESCQITSTPQDFIPDSMSRADQFAGVGYTALLLSRKLLSDSKVGYLTVIWNYAGKVRVEGKEQVGQSRALFPNQI